MLRPSKTFNLIMFHSPPKKPNPFRFCDVCEADQNPKTMTCDLCTNKGGAYKMTDKATWVHNICSNWIPEVYQVASPVNISKSVLTLSSVDKKRFRLSCDMCKAKSKGACVQCTFGRCISACHPWCMIHDPRGWTKRVAKEPESGEMVWEMYCKTHAHCVAEPVKPRPKPKANSSSSNQPEEEVLPVVEYRPKPRARGPRILTMSHQNQKTGRGPKATNTTAFAVRTFSEWPGQAEGEGMDLDHFWKVVGMAYPEDHNKVFINFTRTLLILHISVHSP